VPECAPPSGTAPIKVPPALPFAPECSTIAGAGATSDASGGCAINCKQDRGEGPPRRAAGIEGG
jgi:hypothetical protein